MYRAIDIEAIRKKVMRDDAEPAGIIAAPFVHGWTKELDQRLPYDVEAAKTLLAEAGYPDGFQVKLDCPNDRYINDEAICQRSEEHTSELQSLMRISYAVFCLKK